MLVRALRVDRQRTYGNRWTPPPYTAHPRRPSYSDSKLMKLCAPPAPHLHSSNCCARPPAPPNAFATAPGVVPAGCRQLAVGSLGSPSQLEIMTSSEKVRLVVARSMLAGSSSVLSMDAHVSVEPGFSWHNCGPGGVQGQQVVGSWQSCR